MLEALKALEEAVLDCKLRSIDTPELHAALDAVEPYVSPAWSVQNFRLNVTSSEGLDFKNPTRILLEAGAAGARTLTRCLCGGWW